MIHLSIALLAATAQTSPSQIADDWLKALNTRAFAKIADFHRTLGWAPSPEDVASQDWSFANQAGKIVSVKDLKTEPSRVERLIRLDDVEGHMVLMVDTSQAKPRLGIRPASGAEAPVESLTEAQLAAKFKAYLQKLDRAGKFSGSAVLAKDGKALVQYAGGYASRGYKVKNRVDTKFNIASMGKMFTTTAIAMLKDEGKLNWDDPVGKFLPDYPVEDVKTKVTIRHLLTHRSGLQDIFTPEFIEGSKERWKTVGSWMKLFQDKPLNFEPGSRSSYSNAGFIVLGAIIEKVSGKNYFDFVRERIFLPTGMKNTDAYELDQDVENIAIGYTRVSFDGPPIEKGEPRNNLFMHTAKGSPAGGSFSTAPDFVKFGEAIRHHKLISKATTEELFGATVPGGRQGLGFGVRALPSGELRFGHSGGFPGINSDLAVYLKSGYAIAVLTNSDEDAQWVSEWTTARIENLKKS